MFYNKFKISIVICEQTRYNTHQYMDHLEICTSHINNRNFWLGDPVLIWILSAAVLHIHRYGGFMSHIYNDKSNADTFKLIKQKWTTLVAHTIYEDYSSLPSSCWLTLRAWGPGCISLPSSFGVQVSIRPKSCTSLQRLVQVSPDTSTSIGMPP